MAGLGFLGFKSASTLDRDVYGDTIDDVITVLSGSSIASTVEEYQDWNWGNIPLSRNTAVRSSLHDNSTTV